MVRVLFVCMGNICRSPTAEGLMKHRAAERKLHREIEVDSAGTHAYHVGEPPDERSAEEALKHGIDLSGQRARRIAPDDFQRFDYILAMDEYNLDLLRAACPEPLHHRLYLLPSFAPHLPEDEVPDPYYGGRHGFARVFTIVDESVKGLLDHIEKEHLLG